MILLINNVCEERFGNFDYCRVRYGGTVPQLILLLSPTKTTGLEFSTVMVDNFDSGTCLCGPCRTALFLNI